MAFMVRAVKCPNCRNNFRARSDGRVVASPRNVMEALLNELQVCPECNARYEPGELLSCEEKEKILGILEEEARPKKKSRCSKCGETGHNRLSCDRRKEEGAEERYQEGLLDEQDQEFYDMIDDDDYDGDLF